MPRVSLRSKRWYAWLIMFNLRPTAPPLFVDYPAFVVELHDEGATVVVSREALETILDVDASLAARELAHERPTTPSLASYEDVA